MNARGWDPTGAVHALRGACPADIERAADACGSIRVQHDNGEVWRKLKTGEWVIFPWADNRKTA